MKLIDYLERENKGIPKAASELIIPYITLQRWILGTRLPRPENMKKIIEWSHGAVQPSDFYDISTPTTRVQDESRAVED